MREEREEKGEEKGEWRGADTQPGWVVTGWVLTAALI